MVDSANFFSDTSFIDMDVNGDHQIDRVSFANGADGAPGTILVEIRDGDVYVPSHSLRRFTQVIPGRESLSFQVGVPARFADNMPIVRGMRLELTDNILFLAHQKDEILAEISAHLSFRNDRGYEESAATPAMTAGVLHCRLPFQDRKQTQCRIITTAEAALIEGESVKHALLKGDDKTFTKVMDGILQSHKVGMIDVILNALPELANSRKIPVIKALGALAPKSLRRAQAVKAIDEVSQGTNPSDKKTIINQIAAYGILEALPTLQSLINDPDVGEAAACVALLLEPRQWESHPAVKDKILAALLDSNPHSRVRIISSLVEFGLGTQAAEQILTAAIDETDAKKRLILIAAAIILDSNQLTYGLHMLLSDQDPLNRAEGLEILLKIANDRLSFPFIATYTDELKHIVLQDSHIANRIKASRLLGVLQGKKYFDDPI